MEIFKEGSSGVDNKGFLIELEDVVDVYMFVYFLVYVCVRFDYYQYLVLFCLKEVLQRFQEQLIKDIELMIGFFLQDQIVCIGVFFFSVEVVLFMYFVFSVVDVDFVGLDSISFVDLELFFLEDWELKFDVLLDQGLVSFEKVLEESIIENQDVFQERLYSNGELQDLGLFVQQLVGKGYEVVEFLQVKKLSRI